MAGRVRPAARTGPYTFDDFCEMVREDQKADLIDGVIYMASPENTDANDLHGWLVAVMRPYARRRKLGRRPNSDRVSSQVPAGERELHEPSTLLVLGKARDPELAEQDAQMGLDGVHGQG